MRGNELVIRPARTNTEVCFLPLVAKFIKKLKDKKLRMLYQEAIDKIREGHTVGEAQPGNLSGIYGYDIYGWNQRKLL